MAEQAKGRDWRIGEFSRGVPKIFAGGNRRSGRLVIGRYCSTAAGVTISLGGQHRTGWVTTSPFGAVDPNARRFPAALSLAEERADAGAASARPRALPMAAQAGRWRGMW
ncbi:MAG: hypothetical protein N3D18_09155 [Roseococcus sp.]|nr:hypothetical protein [Roseococcus sp.]